MDSHFDNDQIKYIGYIKNNELDSAEVHCKKAEKIAALINDDEVNHHSGADCPD